MDLEQVKKEFGKQIKIYRQHNKQTQEQFAEIIDIEQSTLSNIESGKAYPVFSTILTPSEKISAFVYNIGIIYSSSS